jgi:DNA ligase-1
LSVGSGLTDEDREKYWKAKDTLIGQLIEIRADAITQSIEGEHFSLRFPRFKTFRGFEPGEKI